MERQTIPIIYQDHHLLIVNKPAGLVVHPTYKHSDGTLWDLLLEDLQLQGSDHWAPPEMADEPGWERAPREVRLMLREKRLQRLWREQGWLERPILLHRLDKDTSGVLALARTELACRHIARQFNEHTLVKTYLAVARRAAPAWARPRAPLRLTPLQEDGETPAAESVELQAGSEPDLAAYEGHQLLLDGALQRDPADRRRCIVGPLGQEARTRLRVSGARADYVLLAVQPVTGRTHQIRAHMAAAGYALVGDPLYAPDVETDSPASTLTRQFLHAYSLALRGTPVNAPRTFVAPLPQDLTAWLQLHYPAPLPHEFGPPA